MGDTIIGGTLVIEGEISGGSRVVVHGEVRGKIAARPGVAVAEEGVVEADIESDAVEVAGRVTGTIVAGGRVELAATARMSGDIRAPRILIADGAQFKGNVDMSSRSAGGSSQ